MPELTLYSPRYDSVRVIQCSPPAWACAIVLADKGLAHRVKRLSFEDGEHKTPEMLALNPRGTTPVLTDGDRVVHETVAILQYLEDAYPDAPLMPTDLDGRALALTRLHEASGVKDAGMALFRYMMRNPEGDRSPGQMASLLADLKAELNHWERYYSASEWSAGEELTLGDILVLVYVATAVQLELGVLDGLPRLQDAYEAFRYRRSVSNSWPQTWS